MKRTNIFIAAIAVITAVCAFFITLGAGAGPAEVKDPHVARLLSLSAEQRQAIDRADPDFDREATGLEAELRDAREALAQTLEDDGSIDTEVLDRVEAAIAAHNELERRVARHLILIRSHLEPQQRSQLMNLCAEGIRETQRNRYRHGQQVGGGGNRGGRGNGNADDTRGRYRGGRGN